MTKTACLLIIHCSALSLCWRSIKAIKSASGADPRSIDAEIPQLWAIIAFHGLYTGIVEVLVSWLPFYYYIKMILLAVTFFPGTRFPAYWFDCFLVPGIDRLHSALDIDWRQYLVNQAKYLPLLLMDLLFLPGVLNDREETSAIEGRAVGEANSNLSPPLQSPSAARSRIVASSLHLRNFSREYGCSPAKATPRKRLVDLSLETPLKGGQTSFNTVSSRRSRRRRRRTMNEKVRKVLCGDENIRIRDFLFDLDMPSAPPTRKGLHLSNHDTVVRVAHHQVVSSSSRENVNHRERRRRTFHGFSQFARSNSNLLNPSSLVVDDASIGVARRVDMTAYGENQNTSNSSNIIKRRSERISKRMRETRS